MHKRCDVSTGIALIALGNVLQKVSKISTHPFFAQLLMSSFRAFFGARGEKNFEHRIGKNDRAHIASFSNQSGRLAKSALPLQQRAAYAGKNRDFGSGGADLLVTNCAPDIFAVEHNAFAFEPKIESRRQFDKRVLVV